MMKNKKVYISGKISGLDFSEASKNFYNAAIELNNRGVFSENIINPMMLPHQHDKSWESYMKEDIKALCDCDAIAMLPNWSDSEGAKIEFDLAFKLKLEILFL